MTVKVQNQQSGPIIMHRGVRQGEVISTKLFTNALEDNALETAGININGEYVKHLRFADDIVIVGETVQDLQYMPTSLADSSARIGLTMNLDQTSMNKFTWSQFF